MTSSNNGKEEDMGSEPYVSDSELKKLDQFLAGSWYQREEDDTAIVQEVASRIPLASATSLVQIMRKFLESPIPTEEEKGFFISKRANKYFPEGTEGPLRWLASIANLLEQLASQKQG